MLKTLRQECGRLWREYFRTRGLPDPFLVNAHSFPDPVDPRTIGFDASVEFPPHQYPLRTAPSISFRR